MIIIHEFVQECTVKDPIKVAMIGVDEFLTSEIERSYVGKCHNGVQILRLIKITNRTKILILKNNMDGYANIGFKFTAECRVLAVGEPLVGCKIIKVVAPRIYCDHPYANVAFQWADNHKYKFFLQPNQLVPVIVGDSSYTIGATRIAVNSRIFVPQLLSELFEVSTDENAGRKGADPKAAYQPERFLSIAEQINDIDGVLTWLASVDAESKALFTEIASPREKLSSDVAAYPNAINFLEMARRGDSFANGDVINFSSQINKILPLVFMEAARPKVVIEEPVVVAPPIDVHTMIQNAMNPVTVAATSVAPVTEATGGAVKPPAPSAAPAATPAASPTAAPQPILQNAILPYLLSRYYMHLLLVRGLIETYNTEELRQSHENLWMFYGKLKQDAARLDLA